MPDATATDTTTDTLTADDLEFLSRPLLGMFTTAAGPVPPQPRPVWFEATTDGTVQIFTGPDSVKVRRLRRDPRASLVVVAPADDRERWISVAGPVTIESDGAHDLARRLGERYWDLDEPGRTDDLDAILAEDQLRIVMQVESVRRFSF